jgi:hypothetical protein
VLVRLRNCLLGCVCTSVFRRAFGGIRPNHKACPCLSLPLSLSVSLSLSLSLYLSISRSCLSFPRSLSLPQGNLVTSPEIYANFLTALLRGNMLGGEIRRASWLDHTSDASYLARGAGTLQPFLPNGEPRWHYSYGHWIECNPSSSSLASCDSSVHSSVGASGFYPVIVRPLLGRTYWAIVAFESEINARGGPLLGAMTDAVMHFRELRAAVEDALSHSRA